MMRLAIPGMVMHVAEFAADEILTIACAQFGAAQLAAQSALVTLTQITWTVPLAISIAASIRVANLIGAKATDAATMAAVVVSYRPYSPRSGKLADASRYRRLCLG